MSAKNQVVPQPVYDSINWTRRRKVWGFLAYLFAKHGFNQLDMSKESLGYLLAKHGTKDSAIGLSVFNTGGYIRQSVVVYQSVQSVRLLVRHSISVNQPSNLPPF